MFCFSFGELGLSRFISKMKVTVVSRSGRELFKGGLELNDSVISPSRFYNYSISMVGCFESGGKRNKMFLICSVTP